MYDRPPTADSRQPVGPVRSLLREYGVAWAERALRGAVLRAAAPDDPLEAVFVDPFAGVDHPLPAGAVPVPVEVLARLFTPAGPGHSRARALLLEEDPVKLDWLLDACRAVGLGERAGRVPTGPVPEIALVEGSWDAAAPHWAGLEGARASLAMLDPPAAGRLPLVRIVDLIDRYPSLDLVLRFPTSDLRRLAGFRGIPLADLPPYARRAAEGISGLLGDLRHGWAIPWRNLQAEQDDAAAEAGVVGALADRLREAGGRAVRVFRVDAGAGAEHVLMASGDPARILLMNEVLFRARGEGWIPWPEDTGFVRHVPRAELELFGGGAGVEARDRVVDVAALAHSLAVRFAGRRLPFREVLGGAADSDLFEDDVKRALVELRRDGRATFRSLSPPDAEIVFPRSGSARLPARSRSTRRRGADDELSLLPDSDPE